MSATSTVSMPDPRDVAPVEPGRRRPGGRGSPASGRRRCRRRPSPGWPRRSPAAGPRPRRRRSRVPCSSIWVRMKLLVPLRMRVDRLDLIGRQALADGGDDRNAAGDRRLEGDRAAQLAGPVEQLRAVLGQQGLVRRDDVLAAFEQLEHDRPGVPESADQLDRRHDARGRRAPRRGRRQQTRGQRDVPRAGQVRIDHASQFDPAAGMSGDAIAPAPAAVGRRPSRSFRIRQWRLWQFA